MADEKPRGIRPIWLLGGGAALGVLALCALLSLGLAVVLIWLSSGRSFNNPAAPTETQVVQAATQAAPTEVILTRIGPTPLPGIGATAQASATPLTTTVPPDEGVAQYFNLVSEQRYDLSWGLLTDGFKQKFNCCAPNYNYTGYTDWWNSVDYVDFGEVLTVSQSGNRAVVYAELFYVMTNGVRSGMDSNPYIEVVYEAGAWRFVDKRAGA